MRVYPAMKSFILSSLLLLPLATAKSVLEVRDGQTATPITFPAAPTDTGIKQVPDVDHPFIAPGPDDQRGPCPGMNTLANHGFIPRNGIATFEEITLAQVEAFNLDINFGAFLVAANMLMRGNPFVNKISIGGVSPLVPPLPYGIGSNVTGGLAKHGGFEGDGSITRADVHIGDNVNFQNILYDHDLLFLGKFGDDGPEGNNTVLNLATITAIKQYNIQSNQLADPEFHFTPTRLVAAFNEISFLLNLFANGTTNQASLSTLGSFLRNQTFPPNWNRAPAPVLSKITSTANQVRTAVASNIPLFAGHNDENGNFVPDAPPPAPFNSSITCAFYYDLFAQMPAGLANTTGVFKENVDLLSSLVFAVVGNPGCDVQLAPFGPADN
ncbi:Chloroperoxidase [Roridomyces roridus]|uniref:Chloroperoxidase n=1 Tax=Roridomyces roridus TaxID=1738132 RepID=A0AAD7FLR7_9AGAR|nr:Chloroperoxidase [Roridomyces roridus]